ncbi:MAG: M20/M25/M40 family metallo-hydrolase [Terriglobales bacterium]
MFYAHYDGQPVTPSEWEGGSPFTPVIREVDGEPSIYARSAGDDKAAIFAQLTALDALRAAKISLRANVRFVWEGEEEAGSPHLEQILDANRDLVHGDVWLVCDGPIDQSGKQTVVFGALRRRPPRDHCLWSASRPAQWSLWELGSESGNDAGTIASRDEG